MVYNNREIIHYYFLFFFHFQAETLQEEPFYAVVDFLCFGRHEAIFYL